MAERTIHYGQRLLLEDRTHSEHLILAGVRYGKTFGGIPWHYYRVRKNAAFGAKISLVVAPDYRLAEQICFAYYIDFLRASGLHEGVHFKPNRAKLFLDFPRLGHRVVFLTGEKPEKIVAYTSSHAWIDESALCHEQVRKNVIKRNSFACPYRQVLHTTTPIGTDHWLFNIFGPDKVPRIAGTPHSISDRRIVLHGRTHDNPYLTEDYLSDLEAEFIWDLPYYQNYVLGEWVSLSRNRFYTSFDESKHVGDYPADPDVFQLYLSFDNNVGKFAWAALQPQHRGGVAVVKANGADAENALVACEQVIRAFPPEIWGNHLVTVYGDAVLHQRSRDINGSTFSLIRSLLKPYYPRLEVRARRHNPSIHDRSLCTNMFFGQNRLHIDRKLSGVILSARATKQGKNGEIEKPKDDNITHLMEAVDRVLMALDPPKIRRQFAA